MGWGLWVMACSVEAELVVPGFCLPKALAPILPIYLQGLLQVQSFAIWETSKPRSDNELFLDVGWTLRPAFWRLVWLCRGSAQVLPAWILPAS